MIPGKNHGEKKFCWFFPPQISWIFTPLLEIDNWNKCINRRQLSAAVTLGLDQSLWPLYQPFYRGFTWSGYSLHAPDFRWNLRSSEDPYSFTDDLTHYELSNVSIITGQWLSQGYGDWYSVSIYPTPQQPGPVKLSQQLISRHQYNSFVFQVTFHPIRPSMFKMFLSLAFSLIETSVFIKKCIFRYCFSYLVTLLHSLQGHWMH